MARIDAIFEAVQAQGASDLHISTGAPPMIRRHGEMHPVPYQELTPELTEMLLYEMMGERERAIFEQRKDVDFSYEVSGRFRVRCNVYEERRGLAGAFRLLPTSILTLEQLGLPPHLSELSRAEKGIVLVTGPPGSGKSTTLAALIDHVNNRVRRHIITIEDPIEYVHQNRKCLVNQREVGSHTPSFAAALRAALREDPDIILVGEIRDYESMSLALTASQTGQLVLGTLHTTSAAETVERMIDTFPADEQSQARGMLATSLRAVIAQRLMRRADDKGRVAAVEILLGSPAVAALIREKKHYQIPSVMQTSRRDGMQLLEDSIRDLLARGIVSAEEAQRYSTAPPSIRAAAAAAPPPASPPSAPGVPERAPAAGQPSAARPASRANINRPVR
ncbi:MAG: type IV pilus twitching motility protein PilT [Candidatus Eiseniibacteriota bacterium]